jgi:hypothetical protein
MPEDNPADEVPTTKEEWDAYEFHRDVSGVYATTGASTPTDVTAESITRTVRELRGKFGPDPFGPRDFTDADGRVYARIEREPWTFGGHVLTVRDKDVGLLLARECAARGFKVRVELNPAALDVPLTGGEDR